jgi:hypothetical protein
MSSYLGKWVIETEDGFETINVLEIDGSVARAVNKNIPLSELGTKYKRPEQIMPNPFTDVKVNMPGLVNKTDPKPSEETEIKEDNTVDNGFESLGKSVEVKQPLQASIKLQDPESQLIQSAIEIGNGTSELTIESILHLNFDFNKIKIIVDSMGIDKDKAAEIIFESIKNDQDLIFESIKSSIIRNLK